MDVKDDVGYTFHCTQNKKKEYQIGGFGYDLATSCLTNDGIQTQIANADTFDSGFKALVSAALGGIALSVLEPLLQDLRDRFLFPALENAVQTGQGSPCASLGKIEVDFYRLFDNPSPEYFRVQAKDNDISKYNLLKEEPFAIARHLFSDILDRNNPVPFLTKEEVEAIEQKKNEMGGSYLFYLDYLLDMVPEETRNKIQEIREKINSRILDSGVTSGFIGIKAMYASGSQAQTGVSHYDASLKHPDMGVTIIIPLTETLATTMRTCNEEISEAWKCGTPEGPANTRTLQEDLENLPLLRPGDAQFFRGAIHMHRGTNERKLGSLYLMVKISSDKKITDIVDLLAKNRPGAKTYLSKFKSSLDV